LGNSVKSMDAMRGAAPRNVTGTGEAAEDRQA
jgi:hypothetical protein